MSGPDGPTSPTASAVFVDPTGRRSRWTRRAGRAVVALAVLYLVALGVNLTRSPWLPSIGLPGLSTPRHPSAGPRPPDLGRGAVRTAFPPATPTHRPAPSTTGPGASTSLTTHPLATTPATATPAPSPASTAARGPATTAPATGSPGPPASVPGRGNPGGTTTTAGTSPGRSGTAPGHTSTTSRTLPSTPGAGHRPP